jgi:hypothetical protein
VTCPIFIPPPPFPNRSWNCSWYEACVNAKGPLKNRLYYFSANFHFGAAGVPGVEGASPSFLTHPFPAVDPSDDLALEDLWFCCWKIAGFFQKNGKTTISCLLYPMVKISSGTPSRTGRSTATLLGKIAML